MRVRLPVFLRAFPLYIFISLLLSHPVFAFSYGDHVNYSGYMYSGCSGVGNFGYTSSDYYVCDDGACGGGRLTLAPSAGGCFASGVFFANRGQVSSIGPGPGPGPTGTPAPQPCTRGAANGNLSFSVTDVRTGQPYMQSLTVHSISKSQCSNCCNANDGVSATSYNGWGLLTVNRPKTDDLNGVELYPSDLPPGYECVSCSGSAMVPSGSVNPTVVDLKIRSVCPYTTVNAYFKKEGEPESANLTVAIKSLVGVFARDQNGQDIPDGKLRFNLIQNTSRDYTTPCSAVGPGECDDVLRNGLIQDRAFSWSFDSPGAGGTFTLTATPLDSNSNPIEACVSQGITGLAHLTVVGCPYTRTSVIVGDIDKDPFDYKNYFEENIDKISETDSVFCDYAQAPGSCTPGSVPGKSINGSWLTHTNKNLRFKVLHQDRNGVVSTGAYDGLIIVRRYTSPSAFVEECVIGTDGSGGDPHGHCTNGLGYADYFLDPNDTSLLALQSGGESKDTYMIQATTLVEKNGKTFEMDGEGCFDADAINVDACLWDSTQAYMKKYANVVGLKWSSQMTVERGDTILFAGFHNFTDPETQTPPRNLPLDVLRHVSGPYGVEQDFPPSIDPAYLKFPLSGGLVNGLYTFKVATERYQGGNRYVLDKSPFCAAQSDFLVGNKICVTPPPSTDPVNCCPAKPQGTSWSVGGILGQLGSYLSLPFRVKLGVETMDTTTDTKEIADYLYGLDNDGVFDEGVLFRAMPPYETVEKFPAADDLLNKRREPAKYSLNLENASNSEMNSGPIKNLAPATFATERLQKYNARPLREEDISALQPSSSLAANVLGVSDPVCTDVRPAYRSESDICFAEGEGADISAADFISLVQSNFSSNNLFKLVAEKTDWLGKYLAGVDTSDVQNADSAYKRDTAYYSTSLAEKYLRPGETVQELVPNTAGDTRGSFVLGFQFKNPLDGQWTWVPGLRIDLPSAQLALRYVGAAKETITGIFVPKSLRPGEGEPPDPLPPDPPFTPPPSPPPDFVASCTVCSTSQPSLGAALKNLLDTVGSAMKVPASVLTGMLRFEGGDAEYDPLQGAYVYKSPWKHVFYYPDTVIEQISSSGSTNPYCVESYAGARGPCQFMPGAWAAYGSTVKSILGDSSYAPDICNLRDCLYAAAAKMRHDAVDNPPVTLPPACGGYTTPTVLPADSCNWTLGSVAAAGYHYYGSCDANYATTLVNYYLNKSCQ